jgi:hypothetical protein
MAVKNRGGSSIFAGIHRDLNQGGDSMELVGAGKLEAETAISYFELPNIVWLSVVLAR